MDSVRSAWLRALIVASGPDRNWVNAREVAASLTRGLGQPVNSHAAGANLRRLRADGFAEAKGADGFSWWRPTEAGVLAAAG